MESGGSGHCESMIVFVFTWGQLQDLDLSINGETMGNTEKQRAPSLLLLLLLEKVIFFGETYWSSITIFFSMSFSLELLTPPYS